MSDFVPADVKDIEACLLRPLSVSEKSYIDILLAGALRRIRAVFPDRMEVEPACGWETVRDVQADIIARRLRSPKGFISEIDGQYEYQLDKQAVSASLEVTEKDREILGVSSGSWLVVNPILQREKRGGV